MQTVTELEEIVSYKNRLADSKRSQKTSQSKTVCPVCTDSIQTRIQDPPNDHVMTRSFYSEFFHMTSIY